LRNEANVNTAFSGSRVKQDDDYPTADPKYQRIIPQCYLKQFVDPGTPAGHEPYVWIFTRPASYTFYVPTHYSTLQNRSTVKDLGIFPQNEHAKVLSGTGFIVAIPCGDGPIKATCGIRFLLITFGFSPRNDALRLIGNLVIAVFAV